MFNRIRRLYCIFTDIQELILRNLFPVPSCVRSNMSSGGKHCVHVFTRGQPRRPSRSAAPGGGFGSNASGLLGPTVASSAGLASASAAAGSASSGAAPGSTAASSAQQSSAASAHRCKTFLLAFDNENELELAFCALLRVSGCLAFFLCIYRIVRTLLAYSSRSASAS